MRAECFKPAQPMAGMAALCLLMLLAAPAWARSISFDLVDDKGQVTEKSYPGKYLMLAIGYTSCPDICPTTLYEYRGALKALKNPDALQPIFITIDPINDDVARLNSYTRYFDPRIAGLSGKPENIRALTDQLGATYGYRLDGKRIENPEPGMLYTVYHSALIYLISPERELLDVYDYQIGGKGLAEALNKVLGEAPAGRPPVSDEEKPADKTDKTDAATARADCPLPAGFKAAEKTVALSELWPGADIGNGPALLNLWAIWCQPCRKELPLLDRLAGAQDQLPVLALNLGDAPDQIDTLYNQLKVKHLPHTRSEDEDLLDRLGARGLPFNALFVDGRMLAVKSGVIEETASLTDFSSCILASR